MKKEFAIILRLRGLLLGCLLVFNSSKVLSQIELNRYNNEAEIKAPKSVILKDGFYIPSGKSVKIYTDAGLENCTALQIMPSRNQNYLSTKIFKVSGVKASNIDSLRSTCEVNQTIEYFDGLNRPLQTVFVKGSPTLRDIIQPIAYNEFGQQDKKYLPYIRKLTDNDGEYRSNAILEQQSFYSNPESISDWNAVGVAAIPSNLAFSKLILEDSPLNRVLEQGAPGELWQPANDRTTLTGRTNITNYYSNNNLTDYANNGYAVRLYKATSVNLTNHEHERVLSGTEYYGPNQLSVVIRKDENWVSIDGKAGTVEEYKDLNGRLVLTRTFNKVGASIQVLSTYYIYDDLGNLCFVLPPGADPDDPIVPSEATLTNFCYQYRYDNNRRLIEKKIPGKDWQHMVYNKIDQMVLTQDGNLKALGKWAYIKYDSFNRVIIEGLYDNTNSRLEQQRIVNMQTSFWENRTKGTDYSNLSFPQERTDPQIIYYYDDYYFPGGDTYTFINASNKTKGFRTGVKVKVIGKAKMLLSLNYYDEEGRMVKSFNQHYKGGEGSVGSYDEITNTYNFAGELLARMRHHYVGGVEALCLINRFTYDAAGRLKDIYQKIGDNILSSNPEILLSRRNYNEIGQLLSKQLYGLNSSGDFAQTVTYSYNSRGWLKSQSSPLFTEKLKYEETPSGATGQYNGNISRQEWGSGKYYNYSYDKLNRLKSAVSNDGNNELVSYDRMGNITGMQRHVANLPVDRLIYNYIKGNELTSVLDSNLTDNNPVFHSPGLTSYTYDRNGNIQSKSNATDPASNLSGISYNYLNLPEILTAGTIGIAYTYDAAGNKLRKQAPVIGLDYDYIGGIQYENGVLKFISTDEGRVVRNSPTKYTYEFTLTDHLGNGRIYFDINSGIARKIQETDYYAFGLDVQRVVSGTENKYQYNGKEKQDQERMYDYGARLYDPLIGRWNGLDPLAENYYSFSPNSYALNSPINLIDPNGMSVTGWILTDKDEKPVWNPFINTPDEFSRSGLAGSFLGNNGYGIDPVTGMGMYYNDDGTITPATQMLNEVSIHGNAIKNMGKEAADFMTDFVPLVGSGKDLYRGIRDGNWFQAAAGVGGLALDIATLGAGSLVEGSLKAGARELAEAGAREAAEQAAKGGTIMGLGLDADLAFHRGTGAITYKGAGWQQAGLTKVDWGRASMDNSYFKQSFTEAAQNADAIKFNVSSFNPSYARPGITNFEFNHILNNPSLLQKTTFIQNGNSVFWNGVRFIR